MERTSFKMMSGLISELRAIHTHLLTVIAELNERSLISPLERMEKAADEVGKAWSGSWLGYQSRVYYQELKPPPPGDHFSSEWGFSQSVFASARRTGWKEYPEESVKTAIRKMAGDPSLDDAAAAAERGRVAFEQSRDDVLSILRTTKSKVDDPFIDSLLQETEKLKLPTLRSLANQWQPKGQFMSRDTLALGQGFWTPPHLLVLAEVITMKAPRIQCEALGKIVQRTFSHMERKQKQVAVNERIGTNVFIGHGRSKEWKDLKDFIQDRMQLPWDEFNRVPVAGVPNTVRLATMLDSAAIAFLVLTAEDETAGGKLQARMNVVHEVGLFQGRLGFTRAIVMLEDGCEEFTNIAGLGQIRFPQGSIRSAFHEVELVLEREGIIKA